MDLVRPEGLQSNGFNFSYILTYHLPALDIILSSSWSIAASMSIYVLLRTQKMLQTDDNRPLVKKQFDGAVK